MIDWELLTAIARLFTLFVQIVGVPVLTIISAHYCIKRRYQEATMVIAWAIFLKV